MNTDLSSVSLSTIGKYLKSVGQTDIANKVLRSMASVNKVLRVVVVRVHGLGALEEGSGIAELLRLRLLRTRCISLCLIRFLFKCSFDAKSSQFKHLISQKFGKNKRYLIITRFGPN